jgi:hypothetical protein
LLLRARCSWRFSAPATAAQRTFVASSGSDAHPCTLSQPCRSCGAAIAKTSSDGEVIVLDSAGYGPVTITQSISITAPAGIYAGVTVTSGDGIVIDGPGIVVGLRELSINGQGGHFAIRFVQGAHLLVEDCEIAKLDSGIDLEAMRNVRIHDNGLWGVLIFLSAGAMQVSIVDSQIANQPVGVEVSVFGLAQVTIAHSTLARNETALAVDGQMTGNATILSDVGLLQHAGQRRRADNLLRSVTEGSA